VDAEDVNEYEAGNLQACHRLVANWATTNFHELKGIVMHKGIGTTMLDKSHAWENSHQGSAQRQAIIDHVAPQVAAMVVKWMHQYGRMHTDPHSGNVSVTAWSPRATSESITADPGYYMWTRMVSSR
jgi:hypothetical protein